MMVLSRKSLLALEAVLDVALHARPDPVQARDITRRQGVPQRYLEQIMQNLVRANILRGVRGPRGGYRLARERRRIPVAEIFSVIGGLESPPPAPANSPLRQHIARALCDRLQTKLFEELDGVTVDTLCRDIECIEPQPEKPSDDFTI